MILIQLQLGQTVLDGGMVLMVQQGGKGEDGGGGDCLGQPAGQVQVVV